MREHSDAGAHATGDFLEYTGVEPERLALLREAIAAGGAEACTSAPMGPGAEAARAAFEQRCAERIQAVAVLRDRWAALASAPVDAAQLMPIMASFDRTLAEAQPFLHHPASRARRRLGSLGLDLIHLLEACQVIALRLARRGASPVMPVQRWIGPAPAFHIWLGAVARAAGWLFAAEAPARRLRLFTRSLSTMTPNEMQPWLKVRWEACDIAARAMFEATEAFNRHQALVGSGQLFAWWPIDPVELREYTARHVAQQASWQQCLMAVQQDLLELAAAGLNYAGWVNFYSDE